MGCAKSKPTAVANDEGEGSLAAEGAAVVAASQQPDAAAVAACAQCGAGSDLTVDVHGVSYCSACWESWHAATAAAAAGTGTTASPAAAAGAAVARTPVASSGGGGSGGGVGDGGGADDDASRALIAAAVERHNAALADGKVAASEAAQRGHEAADEAARLAATASEREAGQRRALAEEEAAKRAAITAQKEATARQAAADAAAAAQKAQRAAEACENAACAQCQRPLREAPPDHVQAEGAAPGSSSFEVVAFASGEVVHALCQEAFRSARAATARPCGVCGLAVEGRFVELKSGARMHEGCFEQRQGRCHHCGSILTGPVAKVTLPPLPGVAGEVSPVQQVRVHAACVPLLQAAVQQQQQQQQQQQPKVAGPAAAALARAEEAAALRKRNKPS
jgi:hypothetical protein